MFRSASTISSSISCGIEPDIEDWTITDLYGATRNLGGSLATNAAVLDGAVVNSNWTSLTSRYTTSSRYTPEMIQHLNELAEKRAAQRSGTVTVEELGEVPEETRTTDQDDRGLD